VSAARRGWRRFAGHPLAVAAATILFLLAAVAVLAPWIAPYPPAAIDLRHVAEAPTPAHPLGTDELGRDVLSRILWGGRVSLAVGVSSMLIAAGIGTCYGAVAGFLGGLYDALMMRAVDFLLSLPAILFLLVLASYHTGSALTVTVAIGLLGWMGMARLVRAQVLVLREREFVLAARSLGARPWRIVRHHLVPNAAAPMIVAATLGVAAAILTEAALDFLGFGVQPDTPTWGNLMTNAEAYLTTEPLLAIAPGLAITLAAVSVIVVGDAIRDALDPHPIR
jgi:peptide/nickel transport system permease protein